MSQVEYATMSKVTKIHQGKQTIRRHFIGEWLEAKHMSVADLLAALNDPERDMSFPEVDKTQVYRWMRGQMPQAHMQARIAAALGFDGEPEKLMQDPTMDWLATFFRDKTDEQKEKAIQMLKLMFDNMPKDGTNG